MIWMQEATEVTVEKGEPIGEKLEGDSEFIGVVIKQDRPSEFTGGQTWQRVNSMNQSRVND